MTTQNTDMQQMVKALVKFVLHNDIDMSKFTVQEIFQAWIIVQSKNDAEVAKTLQKGLNSEQI